MAEPSTAAQMVAAIEAALLQQGATVRVVSVDGQSVTYDRPHALRELKYWRARLNRETGNRPRSGQIDLGGAW